MLDQWCDHYADIFKLQHLTGLRIGKSSGLHVQDVIKEDDKMYLDVDHSLFSRARHLSTILSDSTKTFAGIRKIFLSPEATEIIEKHMRNKDLYTHY